MKCSSRSTALSSSAHRRAWLVVGMMPVAAGIALGSVVVAAPNVEQAIADAIRARVGDGADVSVTLGQVQLVGDDVVDLEARPVPGARLARPTRFTLYRKGTGAVRANGRVGYAVAETRVSMEHVRAARPIGRGTVLSEDDLVLTVGDIGGVQLKPLPTPTDLIGARASRALRAGDLVTGTMVSLPKLVRARESVVVSARVGVVTVFGRATATQSGELGEVISLVNEESGRRLKGRVVALGEVEVVQ